MQEVSYVFKDKLDESRWLVEHTKEGYVKVKRDKELIYEKYSNTPLTNKAAANLFKKVKMDYYDSLKKTTAAKFDAIETQNEELHMCLFCHTIPKLFSRLSESSLGTAEQRYLKCNCGIITIYGDVATNAPRESVDKKIISEYNSRMPILQKRG